jgi:hypothetical protein
VSILWRKRYLINSCGIAALLGDRRPVHRVCSQRLTGEATRTGWQAACKIRVAGLEPTEPLHGYRGGGLESPVKKGETVKSLLRVVLAFIAICAFGISGAVAQDTHSQGTASSAGSADAFVDQQFALLRRDIRSVNDTRTALIKEYGDAYGSLTDEQADSLIRRWLDTDIAASELRRKYVSILRKVLDGRKAATFFQLDRRISMMIDLQLTSQLPLVQSQD